MHQRLLPVILPPPRRVYVQYGGQGVFEVPHHLDDIVVDAAHLVLQSSGGNIVPQHVTSVEIDFYGDNLPKVSA